MPISLGPDYAVTHGVVADWIATRLSAQCLVYLALCYGRTYLTETSAGKVGVCHTQILGGTGNWMCVEGHCMCFATLLSVVQK